jgi:hypothetical protein
MAVLHTTSKTVSGPANEFRRMDLSYRRNSVCILMNSRKRQLLILYEHPARIIIRILMMINFDSKHL